MCMITFRSWAATLCTVLPLVMFTGLCLAIGVGTWIFSAIKFQSDMDLMLTFMLLWNTFGALWLMPALARFQIKPEKLAGKA
jgi:predicted RND superfamily exporter protein